MSAFVIETKNPIGQSKHIHSYDQISKLEVSQKTKHKQVESIFILFLHLHPKIPDPQEGK